MLKKIIGVTILASSLLLVGCGIPVDGVRPPSSTNFGKLPADYKVIIKKIDADYLKDPYSAKYTFGKPFKSYLNDKKDGSLFWKGMTVPYSYNAKNSYGAYIGTTSNVALFNSDGTHFVNGKTVKMERLRKY